MLQLFMSLIRREAIIILHLEREIACLPVVYGSHRHAPIAALETREDEG